MFCRIYTTGKNINETILLKEISHFTGLPVVNNMHIESDHYFIIIKKNDECDLEKAKKFPDGFLYFKLLVEFEFDVEIFKPDSFEIVSRVLNFLWSNGNAAVASCSFEDDLPYKGGYNNRKIPWI